MKASLLALLLLAACSDTTTNVVNQLNLDRPVDIAFACYGGLRITDGNPPTEQQDLLATAQPRESCDFRSTIGSPRPPGQEDIGNSKPGTSAWFAFILQSGPGTVAVASFRTLPRSGFTGSEVDVLDADPLTPGKNGITVGEDPIAIATDKVGCYEIIANAGSCDLSTLEVNSAVAAATGEDVEPIVQRMEVRNALGEVIRARPAAMAFEPPGGTIGVACPAQPTGIAYIAYPSCHLVAGVDVSTGTIVTGIQFDAAGVPSIVGGNVSCPAECDGAVTTPGVRPVTIDIEKDPRIGRVVLAIGADNSNQLTVYDLDLQTHLPLSLVPPILLENPTGRLGVTTVAISPVIGMGGFSGELLDDGALGGDHQFIYAVATDATVRVADITGAPRECDAQTDPRYLRSVQDVSLLACLPVSVPATACTMDSECAPGICSSAGMCAPYPRRPGARGPGIELIGDAVPTSVDVATVPRLTKPEVPDDDTRQIGTPNRIVGYIGLITAASGRVFAFNVDDDNYYDFVLSNDPADAIASQIPLAIAHQLRDLVPNREAVAERTVTVPDPEDPTMTDMVSGFVCDHPGDETEAGPLGGPRLGAAIQRTLPAGVIAPEKTGGLPSIRQVLCHDQTKELLGDPAPDRPVSELFFSAPLDIREEVFPDLRGLRADETWTVTWEGSLSNDRADTAVDGPAVRMSQLFIDGFGMHLVDNTRPYCDAGVEQFDIVQMRGCDPSLGDAGCPIGYACYVHPQSQVTGIGACMLANEAERLANACRAYLTSQRRYTVGRAKSGELLLLPRKHVLRTTPLAGCTDDTQCEALGDYATQNLSSLNPGDAGQPTDPKTWACRPDTDRSPIATGKRCIMVCSTDADCATGTVCQLHPGATPSPGFCMEGVTPPQACVNAPQRYELRAGEALTVLGSLTGYVHPMIVNPGDDVCVRDPNANPMQIGRIPLDPPDCDPAADPRTGRKPDGTFDANPCKHIVKETEFQLNYVPGSCTLADPDESVVTRDATGLRFRNRGMQLTIVDPTYQGDLMCHGDRQGTLVDIPLVMTSFQLAFRQVAGFVPYTIPGLQPALPIRVVRGPTNSFWVIDEGDFLSSSIAQASTRGKVFRIESHALGIFNQIQ